MIESGEATSTKDALEKAAKADAYLAGANLALANLALPALTRGLLDRLAATWGCTRSEAVSRLVVGAQRAGE